RARVLRAALRAHRALPAGLAGSAERAASARPAGLRDPSRWPVAAACAAVGAGPAPELVRGAHRLSAGQLGRAVVAVDRGGVLPRLPAGLPVAAPAHAAGAATGAAGVVAAMDARGVARQRDLAGEGLPAGHGGDRHRCARRVAGRCLAAAAAYRDAVGLAGCRGPGRGAAGWRRAVALAARRLHAGAHVVVAVPAAVLPMACRTRGGVAAARPRLAAGLGADELRDLPHPHVR